jgi:hypothetical protein
VVFEETTPAFRHAILRTGPDSWLHPAQATGNEHGAGLPAMFQRGHLDHIALTASSLEALAIGGLASHWCCGKSWWGVRAVDVGSSWC